MTDLRIALIGGGGFMGVAHSLVFSTTPLLNGLDVKLHKEILVDVSDDLAASAADRLGWNTSSSDWRTTVSRPDIDIVDIVAPPHLHADIAIAAVEAGKHVLCEKPLANSADEALEMARAAARAGVVTQVGFNYRHTPAITVIKQELDSGRLGIPVQLRASYLQDIAGWVGWRSSRTTGGSGTAGDIGSHVIDLAEYLCGSIARVTSRLRSRSTDWSKGWRTEADWLDSDIPDDAAIWLAEFTNGAIGTFAVTNAAPGRKNRLLIELDCTQGAAEFDWNHREEVRLAHADSSNGPTGFRTVIAGNQHPDVWYPVAGLGFGYLDGAEIQVRKFIEAIIAGRSAYPDFAAAAHVAQVVRAISESARTASWTDVSV